MATEASKNKQADASAENKQTDQEQQQQREQSAASVTGFSPTPRQQREAGGHDGAAVRRGDPLHGEHEQKAGEFLDEREVTTRADKQRAEAQKDEPKDYPGDSGVQAAETAEGNLRPPASKTRGALAAEQGSR